MYEHCYLYWMRLVTSFIKDVDEGGDNDDTDGIFLVPNFPKQKKQRK